VVRLLDNNPPKVTVFECLQQIEHGLFLIEIKTNDRRDIREAEIKIQENFEFMALLFVKGSKGKVELFFQIGWFGASFFPRVVARLDRRDPGNT
jgi:hypothetical protein